MLSRALILVLKVGGQARPFDGAHPMVLLDIPIPKNMRSQPMGWHINPRESMITISDYKPKRKLKRKTI